MRTIAIGDVHGCRVQLEHLLAHLKPAPDDTVVMLGDYVDRGPDSKGVIDVLRELQVRTQLVCLRGNHEIMMLDAYRDRAELAGWLSVGGTATLDSYGAQTFDDVPASHWDFLKNTLPFHEDETHIFVHANAYPDVPMTEQPDVLLYWERFGGAPHQSGKTIVCGHTSQKSGRPVSHGHAICIDTHAYGGGWLTALDTGSGQYWQANDSGDIRTDHISACE